MLPINLVAAPVMLARPAPASAIARISPTLLSGVILPVHPVVAPPRPEMPLLGVVGSHLLQGWPDSTVRWFLPAYMLVSDPDPTFAFAATQSGVDEAGNPFNKLCLTLRVKKLVPQDIADQLKTTPADKLREIPLRYTTATLTLAYKDSTSGAPRTTTLTGAVRATQPDGSLDLAFDNILGVNVVILFENLRNSASATLSLAAQYSAWPARTNQSDGPPIVILPHPPLAQQ